MLLFFVRGGWRADSSFVEWTEYGRVICFDVDSTANAKEGIDFLADHLNKGHLSASKNYPSQQGINREGASRLRNFLHSI